MSIKIPILCAGASSNFVVQGITYGAGGTELTGAYVAPSKEEIANAVMNQATSSNMQVGTFGKLFHDLVNKWL